MSRKDKFLRKCISCGDFHPKNELIKITKNTNGEIVLNPGNDFVGRSVYICKNLACIENSFKKNRIQKNIRANVTLELNEIIRTVLV
ncbi:MAG: YlxR family protein [Candidatus Gastranaerophilales bacterium]|nr:YlxR family protein [Candidatus Gastranaerophilales bacterium]